MENNNLMDICPSNGSYTWTNKRSRFAHIAARLDRFLLSLDWKISYLNISSEILSLLGSDHFPISLNIIFKDNCSAQHFHSSFKFESMWLRHPKILQNIQQWWNEAPVDGLKMHQFAMKLKYVKTQIRIWNQQVLKNVFDQKEVVKHQLEEVYNQIIQKGMNEETYAYQKNLQIEWEELCVREEKYWRQKSRELWL